MSKDTLTNLIKKSLELHEKVNFIWHGGEPLLMPLSFYEKAVKLQQQYPDKKVENGFQTNGTLVTDEVLDFCETYKFTLGFSLDGPQCINDRTRYFRDGRSSFQDTFTAIKKAKQRKVGGGAIVVLNRLNIEDLTSIYEFAKQEGINLKINPLIKAGRANANFEDLGLEPAEYGQALVKLFDQWFYDGSSVKVDPFEDLMGNIFTGRPWGCNYSQSCQYGFISVEPNGDTYPCGRFYNELNFKFGNINVDKLEDILGSAKRKHLQDRHKRVDYCRPCNYSGICNSGCMHNAYMAGGDIDSPDYYCASYKIMFAHISQRMEEELVKAEVN